MKRRVEAQGSMGRRANMPRQTGQNPFGFMLPFQLVRIGLTAVIAMSIVLVACVAGDASGPGEGASADKVDKPIGTFASSGALDADIYANPNLRGVLIRVDWASIEPSPGVFDFSSLAHQVASVRSHGLSWSLAVVGGGVGSPSWLTDPPGSGGLGAPYVTYRFRGKPGYKLPLFWNPIVQERLKILANALAAQYNNDPNLKLVYVTQMTSNGIEGHLQGVDMADMVKAGYTDARWIQAGKDAARSFAYAFTNKAIAFEVHEVNGSATVPATIINDLWNDPTLGHRVGAAMWWISGKESYQPALIAALMAYPGDIYGQAISRSDQTYQFKNGDYTTVFTQARALRMRYVELWEYEFKRGPNGANGAWDTSIESYNKWADATFGAPRQNRPASRAVLIQPRQPQRPRSAPQLVQPDMPDITYRTVDGVPIKLDLYFPQQRTSPAPLVVYVHGGGWTGGDKRQGAGMPLIPELLRRGYAVASVNYRLAPQYKFPAMIEDVACAIRFLRAHAKEYQLKTDKIGVWGGSAGGHLVALLGTADETAEWNKGEYQGVSSRVQAVVDMFGPADFSVDFAGGSTRLLETVFGTTDRTSPILRKASPTNWVSKDDPPFLILHGELDRLVPLSQSERLYKKLQEAGVPATLVVVKNAGHSFMPQGGPISPGREEITRLVADFFDKHLR